MTALAESFDGGTSPVHSTELEIVSTVLRMASAARVRLAEALDAQGLSWARYEVLELVSRRGPMSYSALSRELVRHRTSITATTASLVEAGLLVRSVNPRNRQQYMVEATDSGHRAVTRAERALERARSRMAVDADSARTLEVLRGIEKQWNGRR
ncbi:MULTISPECIES: MarR family transcriptional regulator [unclassified Rhodococcus (in: high G+C Gram-positive bacteria)]|uniref:MarR family transcriptional regulator n=1 Tax=unclassified Rhodococcus (in: high G+C Gram-positive bacteria) TaxID=192944 RepID=UPI000B1305A6|nr:MULTISPECIES: MarR family transcriptional regulator [unclassified Rhodococcus (in: high G+C Gram-positive bacteria)]MDV7987392.1 MarR family transcriptional regulator [Rhodococcus sp. IEGM 1374]MDZ7932015.1 MarR family transcriptional regulator [Rhodococcus sp. (in: high G+C Gram-positive bacteria)]RMB76628.1 MarR family transcriptional regulator [Rhodococcus sp. SBT000017]